MKKTKKGKKRKNKYLFKKIVLLYDKYIYPDEKEWEQ
jgi:hypothetical protein